MGQFASTSEGSSLPEPLRVVYTVHHPHTVYRRHYDNIRPDLSIDTHTPVRVGVLVLRVREDFTSRASPTKKKSVGSVPCSALKALFGLW